MDRVKIQKESPASGRRSTLCEALEHLYVETSGGAVNIVEIGASRNCSDAAMLSDGWSTRVWAWYVSRVGGRVHTIDVNGRALINARSICGPWAEHVDFHLGSAEKVLPRLEPADLLYMDGPADAELHLHCYRACRVPARLVLFDDIIGNGPWTGVGDVPSWYQDAEADRPWAPKGTLAVPAMLDEGYSIIFDRQHQLFLQRPVSC